MRASRRVLAVASAGGHWVQLRRLRPAWDGCRVTYVTTNPDYRDEVMRDAAARGRDAPSFSLVPEATRWDRWKLVRLVVALLVLIVRERPDVVVTTGAAPGYLALRIGKLFGARTIWLDSIANTAEMSLSGRLARSCADLWLTQWPHVEGAVDPDARLPRFEGAVV